MVTVYRKFSLQFDQPCAAEKRPQFSLRASIQSEPTIDLCMKKWGQTTLIDPTLEKLGGQLTPLTTCFHSLCSLGNAPSNISNSHILGVIPWTLWGTHPFDHCRNSGLSSLTADELHNAVMYTHVGLPDFYCENTGDFWLT